VRLSAQVAAAALLAAVSAQAAYHYIHYPSRTNFTPIYEKFNLAALPNNTVTFFVADQAPNFYPNNEFGSVLSQIRRAAAAWNSVAVSDLRVAFGGLQSFTDNPTATRPGSALLNSATPGGDILFVDTPGVLGMGAPTISTVPVQGSSGAFYPIVRGLVMISRETNSQPWPSSAETFFTTAVHEMGHALGLQHTWTGSAMSQGVIRTTSYARPIDADDIASLALLYGKPGWQANYGSISGRVTSATGAGVSMASVVAISPTGPAVSALTHPDGTYRIDGLPANNSYSVYVHPLPPDAVLADDSGLRRPVDLSNIPFNPGAPFQTVFYSGGGTTLDPSRATAFAIDPGDAVGNINFAVQARAEVPTYHVQTYSRITAGTREYGYPGDTDVVGYPGFISANSRTGLVVVRAQSPALLPIPQSVGILGGVFTPATLNNPNYPSVMPWSNRPGDYISVFFLVPSGAGTGLRHLVFNFGNDIYVLPSGINLVRQGPPTTAGAGANADGTVTVTGAGLGADSRVFFDGAQASHVSFSGTDAQGALTVLPPPGANGQVAQVTVHNSDGQNSTILRTGAGPAHTYPASGAPLLTSVSPNSLPPGTTALVEVTVANMTLVEGQVTIGFGTGDVQVRRVWVMSPTRALVNVSVAGNAVVGLSQVTVISGMQVAAQANAFQTQPARAGVPTIASVVNADPTQQSLQGGQFVTLFGQNLTGAQISLNDVPVQVAFSNGTQTNFVVPAGFPTGLATLRLISSAGTALPVGLQIDAAPPAILAVNTGNGIPGAGDTLQITVSGVDAAAAGRIRVTVSGLEMAIQQITAVSNGVYVVQITVNQSFGGAMVPVVASVDGAASAAVQVTVR
jgi:hypothetical protein